MANERNEFKEEAIDWVIVEMNSNDGPYVSRFRGTKDALKERLVEYIVQDYLDNPEDIETFTKSVDEITERGSEICASQIYKDYRIDYYAKPLEKVHEFILTRKKSLVTRPLCPKDIEKYAKVAKAMDEASGAHIADDPERDWNDENQKYFGSFTNRGGRDSDYYDLVGYCTIGRADVYETNKVEEVINHPFYTKDSYSLSDVFVKEYDRDQYIGRQMVLHAIAYKRLMDGSGEAVFATITNDSDIYFFETLGFQLIPSTNETCWYMVLPPSRL